MRRGSLRWRHCPPCGGFSSAAFRARTGPQAALRELTLLDGELRAEATAGRLVRDFGCVEQADGAQPFQDFPAAPTPSAVISQLQKIQIRAIPSLMHTDALICGTLSVLSLACLRMAVTPVFVVLGGVFGLIGVALGALSHDRLTGKVGASLGLIGVLASLAFFLLLAKPTPRVSPTQVPTSAAIPAR